MMARSSMSGAGNLTDVRKWSNILPNTLVIRGVGMKGANTPMSALKIKEK